MRVQELIEQMAAKGRYHFIAQDVALATRVTVEAVRAQLRRLRERGIVACPARGFYVIVPFEYRNLGCLPAEQFIPQLFEFYNKPYYFCLLTAAQKYGAAHQRPQKDQVVVQKNHPAIECGKVHVEFIARGDIAQMPVFEANTPRGVARYSTPEVTALELVGYPGHAGGLSNVATVLAELGEVMDGQRLAEAAKLSPVSWSQRLGYLLELSGQQNLADSLAPFVKENAKSRTPLRRSAGMAGKRIEKWKLILNVEMEPDL